MHVIKIAMLIAASFRDETVMTKDDLLASFHLINEVEEKMPKVFANVGKNPLTVDYDEVHAAIIVSGTQGLTMGQLLELFKHSVRKDELTEVLESLMAMKRIMLSDKGTYVNLRRS
jgi:hypothetical protein